MTEEQAFQKWFKNEWKFGSSTDEAKARRAWVAALNANLMEGSWEDIEVDPERMIPLGIATGILVRTKVDGKWQPIDICCLTKESLLIWLRSRGGKNEWAENTVLIILGHG